VKRLRIVLFAALALMFCATDAMAQSRRSSGGYRSSSPGTGSKRSSTSVGGYSRNNGTRVAQYRRTTPDRSFTNNYSTKGNVNPYTGKSGTRVTPRN
jgi:hypothetical protein